jgi:hypothetical protein
MVWMCECPAPVPRLRDADVAAGHGAMRSSPMLPPAIETLGALDWQARPSPAAGIIEGVADYLNRLGVRGVRGYVRDQRYPGSEPGLIERFALPAHESVGQRITLGAADRVAGGVQDTGSLLTFACQR